MPEGGPYRRPPGGSRPKASHCFPKRLAQRRGAPLDPEIDRVEIVLIGDIAPEDRVADNRIGAPHAEEIPAHLAPVVTDAAEIRSGEVRAAEIGGMDVDVPGVGILEIREDQHGAPEVAPL